MKDWSDLEEKYQDIRAHDPVAADAFKRWMTARFQETVAALEESGAVEKHQLSAMHQQRVQVRDVNRLKLRNRYYFRGKIQLAILSPLSSRWLAATLPSAVTMEENERMVWPFMAQRFSSSNGKWNYGKKVIILDQRVELGRNLRINGKFVAI